jgi:hypothetical protein
LPADQLVSCIEDCATAGVRAAGGHRLAGGGAWLPTPGIGPSIR